MTVTETETAAARRWFGVLAPEGVKSGDRRRFREGALRMRSLPLPLTWQKVSAPGHEGSVTVASIQEVWREGGLIWGAGEVMDTPEADEWASLVDHFGRYGVSIDADDIDEFSIELTEDGTTDFLDARVCSASTVSIPAFAEAFVMLGNHEDFAADFAGGWGAPSQEIPTRENEGQDECEERDEDGNCVEREPGAEKKKMALDETEEPPPCSCDEADENYDPECDCDEAPESDVTVPDGVKAALETIAEEYRTDDDGDVIVAEIDLETGEETDFKDYTPEQRKKAHTLPDGSFPIEDCSDLKNAIQAIGRAKDPAKAKAHIRSRKSDLGCPDVELPDTWALEGFADVAPGRTEDGPGWLTHPVDTDRLRDYWVQGPGAAKIAWGTPDDFYRCEAQLAKYVKPQYLKGYCANRHYDALGFWPGQPPHTGETMTASASTTMMNGVVVGTTNTTNSTVLVAAAPKPNVPRAWFDDPKLEASTALTVTPEGRVFGHLATWGQCHIGFDGECILLPKSANNYSYFHVGVVDTDGYPVYTGALTIGGGHAGPGLSWRAAMEHYDTTSSVVADIRVGEDEHGVWMAGAIRDGVSEDQIRELKAAGKASGDWREVVRGSGELELVAALTVNVGGFPVPRLQVAASGGHVTSLVAAGIVLEDDPIDDLTDAIIARMEQRQKDKEEWEALQARVAPEKVTALKARLGGGN